MATRVLLVEDEPHTRGALHDYFTMQGLDVRSTAHASEAIEIGRKFRPHVLLCDWCLEGRQDGVDVAKTLTDVVDDVEILFMTGLSLTSLERICEDMPVRAFFRKPVSLCALHAELEEIGGSQSTRR